MTLGLAGKRIVVTRAEDQVAGLMERLRGAGAIPIMFPTICVVPPVAWNGLDAAIKNIEDYDWVIFTSVNGVKYFFLRWYANRADKLHQLKVRFAVIGPATAAALLKEGIKSNLVPEKFVAEAIIENLIQMVDLTGCRFLLPRADIARGTLVAGLVAHGAIVNEVIAYRTVLADPGHERINDLSNGADFITFTSPSTVRNFAAITKGMTNPQSKIACIGPITAQEAGKLGYAVDIIAKTYSIEGLVDALIVFCNGQEE